MIIQIKHNYAFEMRPRKKLNIRSNSAKIYGTEDTVTPQSIIHHRQ